MRFAERPARAKQLGLPDRRIGTAAFRERFQEELVALPLGETTWHCETDLFIAVPHIGLTEKKTGGALDTSNAPRQASKIIRGALAYGDPDVGLSFALAYANDGEGRPVKGQLARYLVPRDAVNPTGALIVGSHWWEQVLPEGISYEEFLVLFRTCAREVEVTRLAVRLAQGDS